MLVAHAEKPRPRDRHQRYVGNLGSPSPRCLPAFTAHFGWRAAFILPGGWPSCSASAFSSACARSHRRTCRPRPRRVARTARVCRCAGVRRAGVGHRHRRVVFNASTVTYPKLFQERLSDLAGVAAEPLAWWSAWPMPSARWAQLIMGRLIDRLNLKLPFVSSPSARCRCCWSLAYGHGSAVVLFGALFMFAVFGQVTVNDAMVAHFVAPQWQAGFRPALFPVVRRQRGGDPDDRLPGATAGAAEVTGTGGLRRADLRRGAGVSVRRAAAGWAP